MFLFQFATLAPLALLIAGSLAGGWWIAVAVAMITLFTWAADHLMRRAAAATQSTDEFPTGDALAVALALILLAGLALAVRAFGQDGFSTTERAGLLIGWGLAFGQIGHPVAHELIHRRPAWMRGLGRGPGADRSWRGCGRNQRCGQERRCLLRAGRILMWGTRRGRCWPWVWPFPWRASPGWPP